MKNRSETRAWELPDSAVLPESYYLRRREFLRLFGYGLAASAVLPVTPTSCMDKFSSVWLVGDYYYGSIDGVSDDGTRRVIREHKRAHGLPEDGKTVGGLLTTMGLEQGPSNNLGSQDCFPSKSLMSTQIRLPIPSNTKTIWSKPKCRYL
jgi:peptidoglycan hydrolase-like protein with peptidoglycan-binding domain